MCRRSQRGQDLIPLDPAIEAAAPRQSGEARRRKKVEAAMAGQDQRVLRDYALPHTLGITSSIVNPTVEANNFELSPALITFVEHRPIWRPPLGQPQRASSQTPREGRYHQDQRGVRKGNSPTALPFLTEGQGQRLAAK